MSECRNPESPKSTATKQTLESIKSEVNTWGKDLEFTGL